MSLILPPGTFDAYLFDCDGTVADSMPLHYVAWARALGEWDCDFPEALHYAWGGRPIADIIASLNQTHGLAMPVDEVAARKESYYYEALPQLTAVPDVLEHIQRSHGKFPFAIVSGSTHESVTASLTILNLLDKFETLVCAGDYRYSKPHPEPFLIAARRLGVEPSRCLVFEDTDMGIQSAAAAGMSWVKVPQPNKVMR
jgi:beta-phosphoglucomutase-like phosphatase (HAD superfamily)